MNRTLVVFLCLVGGLAVLGFLAFVGVVALRSMSEERIGDQVVLELNLETTLMEDVPDDPFARVLMKDQLLVRQVVDALYQAAGDDRVVGLVVRIGSPGFGMAVIQEIRDAIGHFGAQGKRTIAWSETFGEFGPGNSGYYLATACDEIHLQPSGDVGLIGFNFMSPFLRGTFDKLDVEPQMDQRHEYKNAMNLYTDKKYTRAQREATTALAESMFGDLVMGIAEGRGLSEDSVRALIDEGPFTAFEAVDRGLIDSLNYRDEVFTAVEESFDDDVRFVTFDRYRERAGRHYGSGASIAIIHTTGAIARGPSGFDPVNRTSYAGSETIARAIRDAVRNDRVKAIILRIDCPGGSYVASDAVWREVARAREEGTPVIASFGNVAASGGYFIAMGADRIVAQPATITGSIGVLGGKLVTTGFWKKLGITFDNVATSENATMWSPMHEFEDTEWDRFQVWLDRIYSDFTGKVAEGRSLPLERVQEIARGRVWSGRDALELGLVDALGGIPTAVELAKEAAGIDSTASVRLRRFPRRPSFLKLIRDETTPDSEWNSAVRAMDRVFERLGPVLQALESSGAIDRGPEPLRAPGVRELADIR